MSKRIKKDAKDTVSADQTKEKLVKYVLDCKQEAEDASKDRRAKWAELWQLYQNQQNFEGKMSWQSKCVMPKLFAQVEKASAEIKRAMLQSSRLFKFELADDSLQDEINRLADKLKKTAAIREVVPYNILRKRLIELQTKQDEILTALDSDEKRLKKAIGETNLIRAYSQVTKTTFLLGLGVPKVIWDAKNGRTKYENVNVSNMYISPDFDPVKDDRPSYSVEYKEIGLSQLKKMAKEANKSGVEVFDLKEIEKITDDWKAQEEEVRKNADTGKTAETSVKKPKKVGLLEFWGDYIDDETGEIEENILMVIANEKYLIRKQDNPFKHGMSPYIFTVVIDYPHRGWCGVSLVESAVKPIYTYNNIVNMLVDNLNFMVNKMYEYNPNNLIGVQDITSIYPGKTIKTQAANGSRVFQEITTSQSGIEGCIRALDILNGNLQEGTFVTEFLQGLVSKKPKTLGEIEIKTAESRGMFDVIAREIEETSLKPMLEMTYDLYSQFAGWPERKGLYQISVNGVTLLLLQKQQMEYISQVLMLALKDPNINQRTDIDDLYRKLLGIYNLSDVYIEPGSMQTETGELTPEQNNAVVQKAQMDAKQTVAQMSPQQITRLAG